MNSSEPMYIVDVPSSRSTDTHVDGSHVFVGPAATAYEAVDAARDAYEAALEASVREEAPSPSPRGRRWTARATRTDRTLLWDRAEVRPHVPLGIQELRALQRAG
ncbi:hypothetical protein [Streptomyces sp. NPDC004435]|uniref:hypothetical protein n=1 Tax=Streptomyces sp. NPDC004435 TaxID=3364701 RepID=UPI0036B7AB0E